MWGCLSRILLLVNVALIVPLLLSYLATYVSPERFWLFSIFGLTYPIWLIANLFFILLWAFTKKWYLWFSILAIIVGWSHARHFFATEVFSDQHMNDGAKLMTFNVRNFDLYNWKHNKENRDKILSMLNAQDPDILCLQEYYTEMSGEFENLQTLKKQLSLPYHAMHHTYSINQEKHFGQVIFSRYPVIDKGIIEFEQSPNNACIYADIVMMDDTFRLFNVHLQSIQLGSEGETAVEEMIYQQKTNWESSKYILAKLRRGFTMRSQQASVLRAAINRSPYKVLVCGDFNDTPVSYTYGQLSDGLQDAFLQKSVGVGATFSGRIPWLRIDYILADPDIEISGFERVGASLSDHYPLVATFKTSGFESAETE